MNGENVIHSPSGSFRLPRWCASERGLRHWSPVLHVVEQLFAYPVSDETVPDKTEARMSWLRSVRMPFTSASPPSCKASKSRDDARHASQSTRWWSSCLGRCHRHPCVPHVPRNVHIGPWAYYRSHMPRHLPSLRLVLGPTPHCERDFHGRLDSTFRRHTGPAGRNGVK